MSFIYRKQTLLISLFFCIILFSVQISAQLSVAKIFSNGMVLQRDINIPVWGTAATGDTITINFDGAKAEGLTDANGKWVVTLPAHSAAGPLTMTITDPNGSQSLNFTNVYVGDVWIASGQSNMEFSLSQAENGSTAIASANDQKLRQFKVVKGLANEPSDELPNGSAWTPATSTYAGSFSAVAYFYGRDLRADLDIPIGIINTSYGGSRIETWMTDDMLGFDESDIVLAAGEPERQPTVAYNKMVHPIIKYPVKGFIWYQGESNADNMEDALAYKELFQTFITGWRNLWGLGDIPFLWVQLPNYGQVYDLPQSWDAWPQLRAGQSAALKLPNTGEAITIDVGGTDIHPTKKEPVGERLALVARKIAYGEDVVYQGPRYKSNLLHEDGTIEINYDFVDGGLVGSAQDSVFGFAIAGEDGYFKWTDAVIDGDKVMVSGSAVADPVSIRYAWEYNPATVNLYNESGLPAAPFYTDINPGFKITKFKAGRSTIETGQSTTLTWNVFGASSITLDGSPVDSAETITITPAETTTYKLVAVNRDDSNELDSASVTVEVLDPNFINRALNAQVVASSTHSGSSPAYAVDGNLSTKWESAYQPDEADSDPEIEWLDIDFGQQIDIERIIINWGEAYADSFLISLSYDGYLWRNVYGEYNGTGGENSLEFDKKYTTGRFMRIYCQSFDSPNGYSIYEVAAYGTVSTKMPPTVTLNTTYGNVFAPETNVTLTASTTDADGSVVKAQFYIDGELVGTDTEEPFTADWTPTAEGEYKATVVVTDDSLMSIQSDTLTLYVDNGTITRFEAEKALYTGQVNVVSESGRSGGKYLQLQDAWKITFNNVSVPEAGEYLLTFGYQMTYETPKTQYLVINGDTVAAVEFTAPSTTLWMQKGILVQLEAGTNIIALHGFWNWMSLDFIGVRGATVVGVEDTKLLPQTLSLAQNYPNPFNPSTTISYSLPATSDVKLDIFDITGRKVTTLVNGNKTAGEYKVVFDAGRYASGVYFYRLQVNSTTITKSMVLLK